MSDKNHPINRLPERSPSDAKDWDQGVPEVPSSPERPLVIPANKHVRDMAVTCIGSPEGVAAPGDTYAQHEAHSHSVAERPPEKL
jgi:hypothetical protein